MSHFYVGQRKHVPTGFYPPPPPTSVPGLDPLMVLSEAIRNAIASGELSHNNTNIQKTDIEARQNSQYIEDSIIWAGQPSLLSMLSDIVGQVCFIDSGAGARLLDTILNALLIDSMDVANIIPTVAEHSSASTAKLLPLILPAIAAALGKHVEQSRIANTQNINGIMGNLIWHGGLFVGEIINSKIYLASTELYDVLNQVAGLMCAAADHLDLPICTFSRLDSGTSYEIVVPCGCTAPAFPSSTLRPPEGYKSEKTTSGMEWTVMTIPSTTGYSFSSLLPSSLPPAYEDGAPQYTADTPVNNVPAQSNQPDNQPLPTSCSSTLPPAYSNLPRKDHVSRAMFYSDSQLLTESQCLASQLGTPSQMRLLKLPRARFAHAPVKRLPLTLLVQAKMARRKRQEKSHQVMDSKAKSLLARLQ